MKKNFQQTIFVFFLGCSSWTKGQLGKELKEKSWEPFEIRSPKNIMKMKIENIQIHLFKGKLKPQIEEGIKSVKWKTIEDVKKMKKRTYNNISIILSDFLKQNQQ